MTFLNLFLGAERDSLEPSEVEAGVGLCLTCSVQRELPAAALPLRPDFAEVGLDGEQPPQAAAMRGRAESKTLAKAEALMLKGSNSNWLLTVLKRGAGVSTFDTASLSPDAPAL